MVRFRTRLTTLIGEISQKKWKNGKGSLKLKMDYVTISFSEMFGKKFYGETFGGNPESLWVRIPPYHQNIPVVKLVYTTGLRLVAQACGFDSHRGY